MDPLWKLVHRERAALVDCLRALPADAWERESMCAGWSVRDVAAHLLDSAGTTPLSFLAGMVRARFDFDRQNQDGVDRFRSIPPEELVERLSEAVSRTSGPPRFLAPLASRIVEEIAHGEDIRRPLGIGHDYEPEALKAAIVYQASTSKRFGGAKEELNGVRLVAEDLDWTHGAGSELAGPAIEILMAITGRRPRDGALSGSGLRRLR